MRCCPLSNSCAPRVGPFSHGQKDDLAEHAGELVVVFVMNTNETEPPQHLWLAAFARRSGTLIVIAPRFTLEPFAISFVTR